MKNPYIIPSIIIAASILGGFWMLKPPVEPPKPPDISFEKAISDADIIAVKQHLKAGADVNARNGKGERPLDFAIQLDSEVIAELLIAEGADMSVLNNVSGNTYLHTAVSNLKYEVAKFLIKKGADVNARNKFRQTPSHAAIRTYGLGDDFQDVIHCQAILKILKLLRSKGAHFNLQDDNGKTPLDYAFTDQGNDALQKRRFKNLKKVIEYLRAPPLVETNK